MTEYPYNFAEIETKFQSLWKENNTFDSSIDTSKEKYYVLEMFIYPSGSLHCGHLRNYVMGDLVARYKRAKNFNVLYPMGWDAFGLPAENAAIQNNAHPSDWTVSNIKHMKGQLQSIGLSYDWKREITTCMPDYYKHEQLFFLEMLENDLAYRKRSQVNWDPVDHTVLANEQVVDGRGWRSGALVEKKFLDQWFLKISDYSEELLSALDSMDMWPDKVKAMQRQWINKSTGLMIEFSITNSLEKIKVFTTRPETIFGASFIAISPNHPLVKNIINEHPEIESQISQMPEHDPQNPKEKFGIKTPLTIQHPLIENKTLPLFIANFILMDYGTGAVFACPAHDERDFEFATKYDLEITFVIKPKDEKDHPKDSPFVSKEGILYNSQFLDGLTVEQAQDMITEKFAEMSIGEKIVNYKLRDWGISRQRYWGCPIPIIHCETCGTVPVPKDQLPVALPNDVKFEKGNPLDSHPTWKHTTCPKCNSEARRETDTFDTFFESSWYFAAFCGYNEGINKEFCQRFLPADIYIGGIEHAILHLLYARFFTRVLKKLGYLHIDEPFTHLLTQGMICHATFKDVDGNWISPEEAKSMEEKGLKVTKGPIEKMSKSKKNVVSPESIINQYGADTARFFILSDTPPERDMEWSDDGVQSTHKFLVKLWNLLLSMNDHLPNMDINTNESITLPLRKKLHVIVNQISTLIQKTSFNLVIAKIYEMYSLMLEINNANNKDLSLEALLFFLRVLEPITPHIASEIYQKIHPDTLLSSQPWPQINQNFLSVEEIKIAIQINGKTKSVISVHPDISNDELEKTALQEVKEKLDPNQETKKVIVVPNKIVNIVRK